MNDSLVDPDFTPLKYFMARFEVLLNELEIKERKNFKTLKSLCRFATILDQYRQGFEIIFDNPIPTTETNEGSILTLSLTCLSPHLPFSTLIAPFSQVVLNTEL
jgi:hypothetical protein